MHGGNRESRAGFTLVEIMVVLAIVALLSAIAIPGLAKLGAFSRDEFKRATNETFSVLRAAQLYSTTYNVNTAVVYNLDQWSALESEAIDNEPSGSPEDESLADPAPTPIIDIPNNIDTAIRDSLTGAAVRQIEAVAVMYQLPGNMGALSGRYVPIPGAMGEFTALPPGMALMLQSPLPENIDTTDPLNPIYGRFYAEFTWANYRSTAVENRVGGLGMNKISAALGVPPGLRSAELYNFINNPTNYVIENFAAHVFRPAGRLSVPNSFAPECGDCGRERYSLYVAPSADRPADERLVDPDSAALTYFDSKGVERSNLRYKEIHLFRSTGRIAVPQDF